MLLAEPGKPQLPGRAGQVPGAKRGRLAACGCRSPERPHSDPGDFPGLVSVDREQHRPEHYAVIRVKLAAEVGDELVHAALRVPLSHAATAERARARSSGRSPRNLTKSPP